MSEKIIHLLDKFEQEKKYWWEKLSGMTDVARFRSNFSYHPEQEDKKAVYTVTFAPSMAAQLLQMSKGNDLSLYVVLLAALKVLLRKYSGREDCVVASPMHTKDEKNYNDFILLRDFVTGEMSFLDLLMLVKTTVFEGYKNQHYPLDQILDALGYNNQRFITIAMLMEGIHKLDTLDTLIGTPENHMTFSIAKTGKELGGRLIYNAKLFRESTIHHICQHYLVILQTILANINVKFSQIELMSPGEKEEVLNQFNRTTRKFPGASTVHQQFEAAAARHPENIAVIFEDQQVNYRDLNQKTHQWAQLLRTRNVAPDSIVALMLKPSLEMVTAILAVLKAGAGYLPIEPQYPDKRIKHILEDSGAQLLFTHSCFEKRLREFQHAVSLLYVDDEGGLQEYAASTTMPTANRDNRSSTNLAYVIYTSGTTGKSKGVAVEHKSLVNYTLWRINAYHYTSKDVALQMLSYNFDGFMSNFYTSLLAGGTLVMAPDTQRVDIDYLKEKIQVHSVTNISLVPNLYRLLLDSLDPAYFKSLRFVVLAGEKADPRLITMSIAKNPGVLHIIEYGPTEAAVTAAAHIGIEAADTAIIGTPIANFGIYILDPELKALPRGVPGEIAIAGTGVARGYLNNPELTAEKFRRTVISHSSLVSGSLKNSLKTNDSFYRTGDLGRWTEQGKIEFLGRIDQQVKINGIRVEPGEIETYLSTHEDVREAVVLEMESRQGDKYLVAGVVCQGQVTEVDLSNYLTRELPHYMVPPYFILLDNIPLTPNGKVDRKVLEELHRKTRAQGEYEKPRNPVEEKLVEVWQEVLGKDPIGINDNFFVLGGDSIKTIQIAAKMNRHGYRLGMKEIFKNPSIAQLAPLVKTAEKMAEQSTITGITPLTPIQAHFFNHSPAGRHHFNQAVLLYSRERLSEEDTRAVFKKIQSHHDALRMVYKRESTGIIQLNCGLESPLSVEVYDLRNRENAFQQLEAKANQVQASIDLENGPLMKVGLFHLDDGDRLLMVSHHLVVDTVSWRILLEDIDNLYRQYHQHRDPEKLSLPMKTDSFRLWALRLSQYANSETFLKEKTYWQQLESLSVPMIETDYQADSNHLKDTHTQTFRLNEVETHNLLTQVSEAFGTEINDIILTGLALGIKKVLGHDRILIALEGHGREEILEDVDIKRTVGWFTSAFPVVLDCKFEAHLGRQIKEIKEHLRRIPHRGIGYGILKYLTVEKHKKDIDFKLKPQVSFNYFGQFDADVAPLAFEIAQESPGNLQSQEREKEHLLEFNGMVTDNQLVMSVAYNKKQFKIQTIERLLKAYQEELLHVIAFCAARETRETTPADFFYKGLTIDELDSLFAGIQDEKTMLYKENIKDIYPLSSMQEGMFFHALYDPTSRVYFLQTSYRLCQEVNIAYVKDSLNELVKRHDILRMVFIQVNKHRPLQVVLKERYVDFHFQDIQGKEDAEEFLACYKEKDISNLFDLSKDVLMRVAVIKSGPSVYDFVWSFHHILMDGWCIGLLISEYFEIYNALLQSRPHRLPPVTSYRTFIQWLEKQDHEASRQYWNHYLEGYRDQVSVPKLKALKTRQKGYKIEMASFSLGQQRTRGVNQLTGELQVTLSTLFQSVWAVILGKYNNKQDVVFGAVVSGRPSEIKGVETLLGSFMTTIPVRATYQENTRFHQLVQQVQEDAIKSEPHHHYSLAEIQAQTPLKQNLFDHIFVFENYPRIEEISRLSNLKSFEQSNYSLNFIIMPGENLSLIFTYNGNLYDSNFIKKMAGHIQEVIDLVLENRNIQVKDIKITQYFSHTTSKIHKDGDSDFEF